MLRSKVSPVIVLFGVVVVFAATACGGATAQTASREKPCWVETGTCCSPMLANSNAWICETGMHVVSSAQQQQFAWDQAELAGTAAIARKVSQMVISKADAAAAELQLPESQKAAFASAKATLQSSLAAVKLANVESRDRWWSGVYGEPCHRLMVVSKADALKVVDLTLGRLQLDSQFVVIFRRAAEKGL